jgi:hypothetical protein
MEPILQAPLYSRCANLDKGIWMRAWVGANPGASGWVREAGDGYNRPIRNPRGSKEAY